MKVVLGWINAGADEDDHDDNGDVEDQDDSSAEGEEGATAAPAAVKLTLDGLLNSEGLIQTEKHQISFGEYNIEDIRVILKDLGKQPSKASDLEKRTSTDTKNFQVFLDSDPRLQKHVFKSKKELVAIAQKLGVDQGTIGN